MRPARSLTVMEDEELTPVLPPPPETSTSSVSSVVVRSALENTLLRTRASTTHRRSRAVQTSAPRATNRSRKLCGVPSEATWRALTGAHAS